MARERAVEGVLGRVADRAGDRLDRLVAVAQAARGELHPPAREVRQRRLADLLGEPPRERRARDVGGGGERLDRPRLGRALVDRRQHGGQRRVAQRAQPRCAAVVAGRDPPAHDLDQQQVDRAAPRRCASPAVLADLPASSARIAATLTPPTGSAGRCRTSGSSDEQRWATSGRSRRRRRGCGWSRRRPPSTSSPSASMRSRLEVAVERDRRAVGAEPGGAGYRSAAAARPRRHLHGAGPATRSHIWPDVTA